MRKLLVFFSMLAVAGIMTVNLTSCGEDEPAPIPTVQLLADIDPDDGYTVNLTVQSTDATSFTWDYGDDQTSTQASNHSYTYEASGDYTISVTATGEGGMASATENVTIAASLEEIIAGPDNSGKTWVLTQAEASFTGKVGGGMVVNEVSLIPEMSQVVNNMLTAFGLGDEYSDEYTFYKDGKLEIDVKNGQALAGIMYGSVTELIVKPSDDTGLLPLCAITYDNVTDATWELSYDDLTVTAYNEFKDPQVMEDVTFTFPEDDANKIAEMKLSSGAYLGFVELDYRGVPGIDSDNSYYILKDVTPDAINIAIGISGIDQVDGVPNFMNSTFLLHLVLVPKQ